MGIYIKGMEMPSGCENCKLKYRHQGFTVTDYCWLEKKIIDPWTFGRHMNGERPDWCPLIPVPPHRRLIDADNLCELCDIMADKCNGVWELIWHQFRTTVEWTPTIIPADPAEEATT